MEVRTYGRDSEVRELVKVRRMEKMRKMGTYEDDGERREDRKGTR
jgi:hypothetical protein